MNKNNQYRVTLTLCTILFAVFIFPLANDLVNKIPLYEEPTKIDFVKATEGVKVMGIDSYQDIIIKKNRMTYSIKSEDKKLDGLTVSSEYLGNDLTTWKLGLNSSVGKKIILITYDIEKNVIKIDSNGSENIYSTVDQREEINQVYLKQKKLFDLIFYSLENLSQIEEETKPFSVREFKRKKTDDTLSKSNKNNENEFKVFLSADEYPAPFCDPRLEVTAIAGTRSIGCYNANATLQSDCSNLYCIGCEITIGCDCFCLFGDAICSCAAYGCPCLSNPNENPN